MSHAVPKSTKEPCCEKLQFAYRLEHRSDNRPVEVVIVAELERCPGPLALGDVVYSTTLLPGERVRLYTAHRNNRYSYDSESNTSYRQVGGLGRDLLHVVHGPFHVRADGDRPGFEQQRQQLRLRGQHLSGRRGTFPSSPMAASA